MYRKTNLRLLNLVLLLALLLPAGMTAQAAAAPRPAQFDCGNVTEIPQTECEALVALYESTDGDNWIDNTGWLQTTTPCSWYGVTCEDGNVTRLNLSNNQLSGSIPSEIGNLAALTGLDLYDNDLSGEIPAEIGPLTALRGLNLWINKPTASLSTPHPKSETNTTADAENVELVGQIGGGIEAVAVQGDYAYIGEGYHLTILDISDPAAPIVVGKTPPMPGIVADIAMDGNYAYVTNRSDGGLRVVDVGDPANPVEIGSYEMSGKAVSVVISSSTAYVVENNYNGMSYDSRLRVVDVSDPAYPTEVGLYAELRFGKCVAVNGSTAYVADKSGGLRIVDVSDPANLTEVGFYNTPGDAKCVAVSGNTAYVTVNSDSSDFDGWLRVVDVSDPANPIEIGFYDTPGSAIDVFVSGGIAYVADGESGLRVVNVSDPANPIEVGFYDTPGSAGNVFVSGSIAYVDNGLSDLRLVDVSVPTDPTEVGFYDTLYRIGDVDISGGTAYVIGYKNISMFTIDVWLSVVDVSNPGYPTKVGFYDLPGEGSGDVVVNDSIAYIVEGSGGLRVMDVSDPTNPTEVGFYDTPGDARGVAVSGNTAYVASLYDGLRVVDIGNPTNPTEVGAYDTPGSAINVFVSGGIAYIADGSAGLRVVDIGDPTNPTEVGAYDTPRSAIDVFVSGSNAYVADSGGLRVVDVSDPTNPTEVGFYDTPGYTRGVFVSGSNAYVADSGGLFILHYMGSNGPIGSTLGTSQSSIPADGATQATLTLSGAPPHHRIRLFSDRSGIDTIAPSFGVTDHEGAFVATLKSSTPGNARIFARDLTTGEDFPVSARVEFTGDALPPPPVSQQVDIVSVESDYRLAGSYPSNVPAEVWRNIPTFFPPGQVKLPTQNHLAVTVDWKGLTPGRIEAQLNGRVIGQTPANARGGAFTVNLLDALPTQGAYTLAVIVYDAAGNAVGQQAFQGTAYLIPADVAALIHPRPGIGHKSQFSYNPLRREGQLELAIYVPSDAVHNLIELPVEEAKLGWKNFQVAGTLSLAIGGDSVALSLGYAEEGKMRETQAGEITIFKAKAEFDVEGSSGFEIRPDGSLHLETVGAKIVLTLSYTEKYSVLILLKTGDMIAPPAGTVMYNAAKPFESQIMKYAYGYITLEFKLGGEGELNVRDMEWRSLAVLGGAGVSIGLRGEVKPVIDLGGEIGLEGQGKLFIIPANCVELNVAGYGKLWVKTLVFERETEGRAEIKVTNRPGNASCEANLHAFAEAEAATEPRFEIVAWPATETPWRLPGGGYRGGYAQRPARTLQALAGHHAQEAVLLTNVFTYTQPALAPLPGGQGVLLWTHDVLTRPLGQNTDIAYALWDGASWSAAGQVSDDSYLDNAPQVAQVGARAVAVWERINDPALPPTATLDVTTTRKFEIAAAIYDPQASTWSSPTLLSLNLALDYAPVIAGASDGSAWAVWIQNEAGELPGNDVAPDRLMAARLSGATWDAPDVLASGLTGLGQVAVAAQPDGATVVYAQTLTHTNGISLSTRLFQVVFDGASWTAPQQITSEDAQSSSPQIFYLPDGDLRIAYLSDARIVLLDPVTGERWSGPPIDDGRFSLATDAEGNITALFSQSPDGQYDLYYAVFDAEFEIWSGVQRLTHDTDLKSSPSLTYLAEDALFATLARTEQLTRTYVVTSSDGDLVSATVRVRGQSDLVGLSWTLERNLTAAALTVSDVYPLPGAAVTVTANISNTGDLPVSGFDVAFESDGIPFSVVPITQPVAGGDSILVTAVYTPEEAVILGAVVDSGNVITESNELDNVITLPAFGADLSIISANVDYWGGRDVGLETLIHNLGTTATPTTTLAFYRDALTGTLVTTDTVPALAAGAAVTLTTPWHFGDLEMDAYALVAAVNQDDFAETVMPNNLYTFTLDVRPDLMVNPYYVWTTPLTATSFVVTATVFNVGPITATNVSVAVYDNFSLLDTNVLFTATVRELGPRQTAIISQSLPAPVACHVYVLVDPDNTLTETTRLNNFTSGEVANGMCSNFQATPTEGAAPLHVGFADTSSGEVGSWHWEFGDGNTSDLQHPSHTYATPDAYTVTLTVGAGIVTDTLTRQNYIQVNPCQPLTDVGIKGPLDITGSLYIDALYTFQAVITPTEASLPITYTWSHDPDNGQGTDEVTYQWSTPDTHTVTLRAENCGEAITTTREIRIWEADRSFIYLPLVMRQH